jgi:hypothetical protein
MVLSRFYCDFSSLFYGESSMKSFLHSFGKDVLESLLKIIKPATIFSEQKDARTREEKMWRHHEFRLGKIVEGNLEIGHRRNLAVGFWRFSRKRRY